MKLDELKKILTDGILFLESNKKIVTPEILENLDSVLTKLKVLKNDIIQYMHIPEEAVNLFINAFEVVISSEKQLISNGLSDRLISFMSNLKNRPLLIRLIASLI